MSVKLDVSGLEQLEKMLNQQKTSIKIGILGDKNLRKDGGSNAEIGVVHEYGNDTMPQRSFLRVPISSNLRKALSEAGLLEKKAVQQAIETGSFQELAELIAIEGVGVVMDAFDSGGDGKWKPSDMTRKKVHQTLVEEQEMRESITYKVEVTND